MNGWPARSAASRKPHPKHIHPGRGAFCAPAVFVGGEMRLNGSKGRGAFRSAKKSRPNTNYIFSIENKISLYELYFRFLYKGIIIKHNKTEPTYTKTSLFLCEKRRFFMARTEKGVVATI